MEIFELGDHFEDVKNWYNGYIFGEVHDIYNPWSIMKYIHDKGKFLKSYWVNTSNNELIREVLQIDKIKSKETLGKLIRGDEVREVIGGQIDTVISDARLRVVVSADFL